MQDGRTAGSQDLPSGDFGVRLCVRKAAHVSGRGHAWPAKVNALAEGLKARTKQFALDVIRLVGGLPRVSAADVIGRQLLKSGTGVAANYRSACRSRSHAEFVARIGVVLEEADESEFWLELLTESALSTAPALARLQDESRQLRAIFAASSLTARRSRS